MNKEKYYDIEYGSSDDLEPTRFYDVPDRCAESFMRLIKFTKFSYYKVYDKGTLVKEWEKGKEDE